MPAFSNPSHSAHEPGESQSSLIAPAIGTWPRFETPLRLAVMASGNGSNFEALAAACGQTLDACVELLVVNNEGCGAQARAERLGILCQTVDHRGYTTREDLDHALVARFRDAGVDGVVMAGWMRIVTPVLIRAFEGRLINLHPSLLPSFRGLDAVGQALAAGVSITGCTAHLVTRDVDTGPVIAQAAVPVLAGDTHESLASRIHRQEHRLLPWAVALQGAVWRRQG